MNSDILEVGTVQKKRSAEVARRGDGPAPREAGAREAGLAGGRLRRRVAGGRRRDPDGDGHPGEGRGADVGLTEKSG